MICFYYTVCDCDSFIKGNLLIYLLTYNMLTILTDLPMRPIFMPERAKARRAD